MIHLYVKFFNPIIVNRFQIPREVPHPDNNTPIDFSNPADIILYIVLPLIMVILYFLVRRSRNKK